MPDVWIKNYGNVTWFCLEKSGKASWQRRCWGWALKEESVPQADKGMKESPGRGTACAEALRWPSLYPRPASNSERLTCRDSAGTGGRGDSSRALRALSTKWGTKRGFAYFLTVLLRSNWHPIKFISFMCSSQCFFSTFTELCNYHHFFKSLRAVEISWGCVRTKGCLCHYLLQSQIKQLFSYWPCWNFHQMSFHK